MPRGFNLGVAGLVVAMTLRLASLTDVSLQAQQPQAPNPLDARVTLDYRAAAALDVLRGLAAASGLSTEIGPIDLRPVTITLTNVRLGTALNAVCENAACRWELNKGMLRVFAAEPMQSASLLPRSISIELSQSPLADVWLALAAALDVNLSVQVEMPKHPLNIKFTNADPANIFSMLCSAPVANCTWELDAATRQLTVRPRTANR
jgi:hypothetical protein